MVKYLLCNFLLNYTNNCIFYTRVCFLAEKKSQMIDFIINKLLLLKTIFETRAVRINIGTACAVESNTIENQKIGRIYDMVMLRYRIGIHINEMGTFQNLVSKSLYCNDAQSFNYILCRK
jgi:hypothetical protein